jgi:hypothetical protein
MSFDRSEIPAHSERVLLNLKLLLPVEFFDFRGSALVSGWHLVPVRGSQTRYFSMGFTYETNKKSG